MSTPVARTESSPFGWNLGAWFGSQFGGTVWMLVGAAQLFPSSAVVAGVWVASFVIANVVGCALWRNRERVRMYAALQLLLLCLAALSYGCVVIADWSGHLASLTQPSPHPRLSAYGALLVIPAVMTFFYLRERFGNGQPSDSKVPTIV